MKYTFEKLIIRYRKAVALRAHWDPTIQDVYDFCLPGRDNMYEATPGNDRVSEIYDDTAVQAIQDFAGMMHEGLLPPYGEIFTLEPGIEVPKSQARRVEDRLAEVAEAVHAIIHGSNAHMSLSEGMLDYGVGTMHLSVLPASDDQLINVMAHPLSQVFIDKGPFNSVDGHFIATRMTKEEIGARYPQAKIPSHLGGNEQTKYTVIDATYRDWDVPFEYLYHRHLICAGQSLSQGGEMMYRALRGKGSCPHMSTRFQVASGEVYGRGPGYNTLASIKTTNLANQLTLENADLAVGGLWKAPHDGVINPNNIELVPGTIIPYMPGTNGLEAIKSGANFDLSEYLSDEYARRIKRGFFVEDYEGKGDTPVSSREVAARQARHLKRLGRPFIRALIELVSPFITRVMYLARLQGAIELPQIDGRVVSIRIVSPLAKQMKAEALVAKLDSMAALNGTIGPQQTQMFINTRRVAEDILDLYDQPNDYIRDDQQVEQMVGMIGQVGGLQEAGAPRPQMTEGL